jgi:glycerol-3-phosphate acyltransferase PlsX
MLKSSEAVAKLLVDRIKELINTGPLTAKIGGLLVRPTLRKLKKLLDPDDQGAAPLLGVRGLVFIGHGRSGPIAIQSAIKVAKATYEAGVIEAIQSAIENSLKVRQA